MGGEDDAMTLKVLRAKIPYQILNTTDGFHLHHRRANTHLEHDLNYQTNLILLQQIKTMSEPALLRHCEVAFQLCGNRDMHRPQELLES